MILELYVQPGASRTGFDGKYGDRLKVKLRERAVDGDANAALVEFLADALRVRRADVSIARGETGRRKTVRVAGISAARAAAALAAPERP